jgi:aminotransferase in exopolysaccharide biosynthesis
MEWQNRLITLIRKVYKTESFIPLHIPSLDQSDQDAIQDVIKSKFVSSVGTTINEFEDKIASFTHNKFSIATVNGTSALHLALHTIGVKEKDLVITQALSFIATTNAILYCKAKPIFIDINRKTLGICPIKLNAFLEQKCSINPEGQCIHNLSQKKISAMVPVHVFGHMAHMDELLTISEKWNIPLIEDAAEALGSSYLGKPAGSWGKLGCFSFNGNKVLTTGGGGMVCTQDAALAKKCKHLSTTAKDPQALMSTHTEMGFNYRMPSLNAALGLGQIKKIEKILRSKKELTEIYKEFSLKNSVQFLDQPKNCHSNFWLNTIIVKDIEERDSFLDLCQENSIGARPIWKLLSEYEMNDSTIKNNLDNSQWASERLVSLPSSPIGLV